MTDGYIVLKTLADRGIYLTVEADRLLASPRRLITEEIRGIIRNCEADILSHISRRRSELLEQAEVMSHVSYSGEVKKEAEAMLKRDVLDKAIYADPSADGVYVPMGFAVRGLGSIEILVPRNKFDPFSFLDLLSAQQQTKQ